MKLSIISKNSSSVFEMIDGIRDDQCHQRPDSKALYGGPKDIMRDS